MKRNIVIAYAYCWTVRDADTGKHLSVPVEDFVSACRVAIAQARGGRIWLEEAGDEQPSPVAYPAEAVSV